METMYALKDRETGEMLTEPMTHREAYKMAEEVGTDKVFIVLVDENREELDLTIDLTEVI